MRAREKESQYSECNRNQWDTKYHGRAKRAASAKARKAELLRREPIRTWFRRLTKEKELAKPRIKRPNHAGKSDVEKPMIRVFEIPIIVPGWNESARTSTIGCMST
jgi:hypothetical protein